EVRKEVDREWGRLTRIGRESLEAQIVRSYLEYISELPWSTRSEDHLDVGEASRILEEDHYGLKDVKDRILEFLAVRQLRDLQERAEAANNADEPVAANNAAQPAAAADDAGRVFEHNASDAPAPAMETHRAP